MKKDNQKKTNFLAQIKFTIIALSFTIFTTSTGRAQEQKVKIDVYLNQFKNDLDIGGMSVALVRGDKIIWKDALGKADQAQDIDLTTKHLFCLGSVSKLFTGVNLLKLEEEGKLNLDEDVNKYLPFSVRNPKYPNTAITIRMLLTHSSSFGDYQELQNRLYVTGDPEMSLSEVSNKFFDPNGEFYRPENFLYYEPGTGWEYSNWNFVLVGYIIEQITGKSFTDYSHEVLLEPLEMKTAGWFISELNEENIAAMYRKLDSGENKQLNPLYGWPGYSDGNLRANVEEAANFLIMIINEGNFKGKQILKPKTVAKMLQRQKEYLPESRYLKYMGLVWFIDREQPNVYKHSGSPTGSLMAMMFNPETNSGFVSCVTGIDLENYGTNSKLYDYHMYLLEQSANY